jgi:two-component system sensor histidine kinase PilS (NtrC family)
MTIPFKERIWLAWLGKARIIVITFLLGIELALVSFTPVQIATRLFITTIVLWYTVGAFYLVLSHVWDDAGMQARLQVLTDLVFATAVVHTTGGIDSHFAFLYPLIIIVAAVMLPRYWAFLTAALSFILFGGLLELGFYHIIASSSGTANLRILQATIFINLFACMAVAYLASLLAGKLRKANVELQEKSGALQDLQALHEHLVKSMAGGAIITDLEGCIRLVNPAGERLLGRPAQELMGTPLQSLFPGELPQVGAARRELAYTGPDKREKVIGMTVCDLIMPSKGVAGCVYTFTDLTEIRGLEREVQMRERMAAVGRLAAGIAHEIRNPLSSIAGSAQMLSGAAGCDPDDRELLDIIRRESQRLDQIVTEFLAYSRSKPYCFAQADLVILLEDTLKLLENRPECSANRVRIVRDFTVPQALAEVDGDRIKQVFWNLCDNALRAMAKGGTLTVGLRSAGAMWQLAFRDSGAGMNAQSLEKIFEPFHAEFARGTGLGLAIVYEIVQAHEGRIAVRSTPGAGTEVTLQLKRAASARASVATAS